MVLTLVSLVVSARAADPTPPPSPYAAWEPLIGGVWSAALPPDKIDGIPRHMERAYTWLEKKEGVRLEGRDFKGDKEIAHVNGLILWNPSDGKYHLQGVFSNGLVTQNILHLEGETLVSDITQTTKDGAVLKARGRSKLIGADELSYQLFLSVKGDWVLSQELRMERHPTYAERANETLKNPPRTETETLDQLKERQAHEKAFGTQVATVSQSDNFEPPKLLKSVAPKYPFTAKLSGKTGTVFVAIVVDVDGHVAEEKVVSSTDPVFESSALNAVKQWAFTAAKKNGIPVKIAYTVPIVFKLQ